MGRRPLSAAGMARGGQADIGTTFASYQDFCGEADKARYVYCTNMVVTMGPTLASNLHGGGLLAHIIYYEVLVCSEGG